MVGDLSDFGFRLRSVLPKGWFPENSPNLQALLTSIAVPWVWLYNLIQFVIDQTRLSTATAEWLNLIAFDFFGSGLARKAQEGDIAYRQRIQRALLCEAATRSAIYSGLNELVGAPPVLFEPANCGDTGSYGSITTNQSLSATGAAYGIAGGWGSLRHPFQFFVAATRPAVPGVGMLTGYGAPGGGYGSGEIAYVDLAELPGYVSDQEIRATLCSLLPANTIAWIRIH